MRKYRIFTFLFFIFWSAHLYADNLEWAKKVFKNPDKYIVNNYEKHLFKKLLAKFPGISPKKITFKNRLRIIDVAIPFQQIQYQLIFETDNLNRVHKISRELSGAGFGNQSDPKQNILSWLDKFFYCIDAGDPEALYDLLFHNKTKVIYNKLDKKKEIIKQLLIDFPRIINPHSIFLTEEPASYIIEVSFPLRGSIYFEIQDKTVDFSGVKELQKRLFLRIKDNMTLWENEDKSYQIDNRAQFISLIKSNYPQSIIHSDTLLIPMPKRFNGNSSSIPYLIQKRLGRGTILPLLSITEDKAAGTIRINNSSNISFYKAPSIHSRTMDKVKDALQKTFIFARFYSLASVFNSDEPIAGDFNYEGYKKELLKFNNNQQSKKLFCALQKEGSIYFFPSHVDMLDNEIIVKGLIYIIKDENLNYYHFGELETRFSGKAKGLKFRLTFYPYLSRIGVLNIREE